MTHIGSVVATMANRLAERRRNPAIEQKIGIAVPTTDRAKIATQSDDRVGNTGLNVCVEKIQTIQ